MRADGFDWDDGNWPKCGKHGVSRAEIEALFLGGFDQHPNPYQVDNEDRMIAFGCVGGRHLLVVFIWRALHGEHLIRPISARYMHRKEVELYERARKS